jgi:spore maturation protein CgeB
MASESDQRERKGPEGYYREIASSRIAVAIRGGGWMSPRYFEIVAMGAMLLSDKPEVLIPDDFVDRRHAVHCKPDLSDLDDLVRHYLREDQERETIATEGRAHLLKYHTCERRAEYFLEICQRAL